MRSTAGERKILSILSLSFKKKKKKICIHNQEERKTLLGKEKNLFQLQTLVCSSLVALNIIYHPPADCKSGLWFPFYI